MPPSEAGRTRAPPHGGTKFNGGEGAWFDAVERTLYFTTKGDDRLWAYHVDAGSLEVFYDSSPGQLLNGVDNVTVSPSSQRGTTNMPPVGIGLTFEIAGPFNA